MAHVTGQCRYQSTLFPETLDDVIPCDSQVRVIDAFVDTLDLTRLGFSKVEAEETGRPPYAPGDLLKLYIYGYCHQIRSSRRLACEARRNIEMLWLINRLTPSFKTIADFRKDHPDAIASVCRAFIQFCRQLALFGAELVAIDGTKIAAVASRKQVITPRQLKKTTAAIEDKIAEYLTAMDEADTQEPTPPAEQADVRAALEVLKGRRAELQAQAQELAKRGLNQLVLTEQDAKLMRTPRGHAVAYNAQIAVEGKHDLIAAFDLTNEGNDEQQLHPMAVQAKAAIGAEELKVVADVGYSNGEHGARCEQDKIIAVVPRAQTVNPHGKQYFGRDRFIYDAGSDTWRCPAGQTLTCRMLSNAQQRKRYATDACGSCVLKDQCTKGARRYIYGTFYDDAREAMNRRAVENPTLMNQRRMMAEHPFGTLKWLMGHPRFLVRGLLKAKAELALGVLAYNLKRVINLMGVPSLLDALQPAPSR